MPQRSSNVRRLAVALGVLAVGGLGWTAHLATARPAGVGGQVQVPTTVEDFLQPGTQPDPTGTEVTGMLPSSQCQFCHGNYLEEDVYAEPYDGWVSSMMGQSARDPVWKAALAIANQDAAFSGEYCIRCHAPGAWLGGRSLPPDGSAFIDDPMAQINDFDGVSCHFCHRLVDPVYDIENPIEDIMILDDLDMEGNAVHKNLGQGRYIVEGIDVRRGPFDDVPFNMHNPAPIRFSPHHRESELCATCHEVRNPVYSKTADGAYLPNNLGAEHPTQNPLDMYPEQTTYSEWLYSQFAQGGVVFEDGRFGGAVPEGTPMQSCQDCHMPDEFTGGCFAFEGPTFFPRPDMPQHTFAGANHWVLRALRAMLPDSETGLSAESVMAAEARTADMLRAASDTEVAQFGDEITIRVTNWSGHRLPTGYPEGRRMWINVQFLDETETIIQEIGGYDPITAELDETDTKIYKTIHAIDETMATLTNLPVGTENHLALNNTIDFDNRIPPVGFNNKQWEAFGAPPVGATYADGQHWDDTTYVIPEGAVQAMVTVYYQAMTKEYIEFLRDENVTNSAGQDLYDVWADPLVGMKAPPVDMDSVIIDLGPGLLGDLNGDGFVNFTDLSLLLGVWESCDTPSLCPEDLNGDGTVDFTDLSLLLGGWTG